MKISWSRVNSLPGNLRNRMLGVRILVLEAFNSGLIPQSPPDPGKNPIEPKTGGRRDHENINVYN